jgi:DNA-binding GntR family transcriptional regulator
MIDRTADRPLWKQLADILRQKIISGEWAPGSEAPSEAYIIQTFELGRDAVRQAIGALRTEGLLVGGRGVRPRVRDIVERVDVILSKGDQVISRLPSEAEQRELAVAPGEPILEIRRKSGAVDLVAAVRTTLVVR